MLNLRGYFFNKAILTCMCALEFYHSNNFIKKTHCIHQFFMRWIFGIFSYQLKWQSQLVLIGKPSFTHKLFLKHWFFFWYHCSIILWYGLCASYTLCGILLFTCIVHLICMVYRNCNWIMNRIYIKTKYTSPERKLKLLLILIWKKKIV